MQKRPIMVPFGSDRAGNRFKTSEARTITCKANPPAFAAAPTGADALPVKIHLSLK